MSCISPSVVRKGSSAFLSPCRKCTQCIASRIAEYTFLFRKEWLRPYFARSGGSFLCLTYDNSTLPVSAKGYMTTKLDDLQRFLKRFRVNLVRMGYEIPVKYVACTEYGGDNGRPHMHICLLGVPPVLCADVSRKSWTEKHYGGMIDVKPLDIAGVSYCLKYLSKQSPVAKLKQQYLDRDCETPRVLVSKGLGVEWINNHCQEIVNSGFVFRENGEKHLYSKKVRSYVEALTGVDPRPFVQDYMSKIDTHGMSLDDFNSFKDYNHYQTEFIKSVQNGTPFWRFPSVRLPPLLRRVSNCDYKALAFEC